MCGLPAQGVAIRPSFAVRPNGVKPHTEYASKEALS
jgi:hypothetical protein